MVRPDPLQELKFEKRLDALAEALVAGRLEEAQTGYEALLAERPDDARVWRALGVLRVHQGQLDAAIQALRRAQELDPHSAGTCNDLGEALRLAGNLEEAKMAYERALALEPDHAQALNNLGVLCMQTDAERAQACFLAAIRAQPAYAHPYNNLGVLLERQGRQDEALRCYEAAVVVQPDYHAALDNYHDLLRRRPEMLADSLKRLVLLAEGQLAGE
ncbi:MAG: tetratricopeptide repeat protein [Methylophilaceae bacterium]|nr:tetratricopeptide repeat protein [Methylophilaceae bacterium]